MEKKIEVAVYLPDAEAKKWLLFQEFYSPFTLMLDSHVFEVRNGSVVLHFDANGSIQAINRTDYLYKHGYPQE